MSISPRQTGPRLPARWVAAALAVGLLAMAVIAVGLGQLALGPATVFAALVQPGTVEPTAAVVVWELRLPRVLLAALAGAALAMAGVAMQALFRNPLADPALLGVASGAALATVATLVVGGAVVAGMPGLQVAVALLGAWGAVGLIRLLARQRDGRTPVAAMLLAGIAVNALAGALIGWLLLRADDSALRSFTFWTLGSLHRAQWPEVTTGAVVLAGVAAALWVGARGLDALQLGEAEAAHLGVPVRRVQTGLVVAAVALVGGVVAVCGTIGFVGLMVPHAARLLVGPRHRALLPVAALLGAVLLVAADTVARLAIAPGEVPVGLVTALLGAPFFLWLLRQQRW